MLGRITASVTIDAHCIWIWLVTVILPNISNNMTLPLSPGVFNRCFPAHFLQLEQSSKRIVVKWIQWASVSLCLLWLGLCYWIKRFVCLLQLCSVVSSLPAAPDCVEWVCRMGRRFGSEYCQSGRHRAARYDYLHTSGFSDRLYSWFSRSSLSMCCRFEREVYHHSSPNYLPVSFFTFTYI